MKELRMQLRPVSALVPSAKKTRTHGDEQVSQIARSIEEFGWRTLKKPEFGEAFRKARREAMASTMPAFMSSSLKHSGTCTHDRNVRL